MRVRGTVTPEDEVLLSRVPPERRAANGLPDPERAVARERAAALVRRALGDVLQPEGIDASPLGPGWSGDLDVYVRDRPAPADLDRLGWRCLDPLLDRLGSDPGEGRWAVIDGGEVLAPADITVGTPPDPVRSVLGRCRRRREVRAREALELRALLRSGHELPPEHPVVALAARVEAHLGGDMLARWANGPPAAPPADLPGARLQRAWRLRPSLRPRLVVAVSGVDGSGKSTLCRSLVRALEAVNVPVAPVWSRPGMGPGLGLLERAAALAKRLLGHDTAPGVRRVAAGERLAWRRGLVGWAWAMLITMAFLADVRRQHVRAMGVLVYDRHLPDALVTLDLVYGGTNLRLHRALIRRILPQPTLAVYLEVTAESAVARAKTDETFGEVAVRRQLEAYDQRLNDMPWVRRLDGSRPPEELARECFEWLVAARAGGGTGEA